MEAAWLTVYIVDDDASVRQALARLVRSAEMHASVFETVPELADQASRVMPDCVIADIRLPETSGLELPRRLSQLGPQPPVIFVTAYDTDQNRAAASEAGALAFFHKPVDGQALLDAIAWAVEATKRSGNTQNRNASKTPQERR